MLFLIAKIWKQPKWLSHRNGSIDGGASWQWMITQLSDRKGELILSFKNWWHLIWPHYCISVQMICTHFENLGNGRQGVSAICCYRISTPKHSGIKQQWCVLSLDIGSWALLFPMISRGYLCSCIQWGPWLGPFFTHSVASSSVSSRITWTSAALPQPHTALWVFRFSPCWPCFGLPVGRYQISPSNLLQSLPKIPISGSGHLLHFYDQSSYPSRMFSIPGSLRGSRVTDGKRSETISFLQFLGEFSTRQGIGLLV